MPIQNIISPIIELIRHFCSNVTLFFTRFGLIDDEYWKSNCNPIRKQLVIMTCYSYGLCHEFINLHLVLIWEVYQLPEIKLPEN